MATWLYAAPDLEDFPDLEGADSFAGAAAGAGVVAGVDFVSVELEDESDFDESAFVSALASAGLPSAAVLLLKSEVDFL